MKKRLERMAWIADTYRLVVGLRSRRLVAAADIHFGTRYDDPLFSANRDPLLRDPKSPVFYGSMVIRPDDPPDFLPTPCCRKKYKDIYLSQYRLPLYQAAFHDSIITTHPLGIPELEIYQRSGRQRAPGNCSMPSLPVSPRPRETLQAKSGAAAPLRLFPRTTGTRDRPTYRFSWLTPDRLCSEPFSAMRPRWS